ncbi:MAG: TolC family protein [Myxococcota bacterium]|nr:TolC family protein [Myxococcota bacterium]
MKLRSLLVPLLILALPASARSQAEPTPGAVTLIDELRLTLREAVELGLENNLDLEIERTGPELARARVRQAQGAFDPIGFAEYGHDHLELPIANPVQNVFSGGQVEDQIVNDTWSAGAGFQGKLPFGLSYSSTYGFDKTKTSSSFVALEPEYAPTWMTEITLPLLRDFFYNEPSVNVKRNRISEQISIEDFRSRLMDLVVSIEQAYWGLAAARAEHGVSEKSMQTAIDLLELTRVQYEVGVVSRVNVTQAEAGVAEREFNEIGAENRAENAADVLLDLITRPDLAAYRHTLIETENPTFVEYEISEEQSVARAMQFRPELEAERHRVEESDLSLTLARNQRLPRLDLTASYALRGLSGSQKRPADQANPPFSNCSFDKDGAPIPLGAPCVSTATPDSPDLGFPSPAGGAHDDFFTAAGSHSWGVMGRVEIPIGNRSARAVEIQRRIEARRARTRLSRLKQTVVLQVREAVRNLLSATRGIRSAERRRVAQQETLRAEEERLRLGDSTPYDVLQFERDLADAERQEIFALRAYRNNIAALERAQGTSLRALGIAIEQELAP